MKFVSSLGRDKAVVVVKQLWVILEATAESICTGVNRGVTLELIWVVWAGGRSCQGSCYHWRADFSFQWPELRDKVERKNVRQRPVSTSRWAINFGTWGPAGDNFSPLKSFKDMVLLIVCLGLPFCSSHPLPLGLKTTFSNRANHV